MNLNHNILVNYASHIYVTAVGILMMPLHIKYMGAEAYDLEPCLRQGIGWHFS